jgi:hypothetical protein
VSFIRSHLNKILNTLGAAAIVAAGVISGGVFTLPVLVTAVGTLATKLAATPVDHSAELETAVQKRLDRIKNRDGS